MSDVRYIFIFPKNSCECLKIMIVVTLTGNKYCPENQNKITIYV